MLSHLVTMVAMLMPAHNGLWSQPIVLTFSLKVCFKRTRLMSRKFKKMLELVKTYQNIWTYSQEVHAVRWPNTPPQDISNPTSAYRSYNHNSTAWHNSRLPDHPCSPVHLATPSQYIWNNRFSPDTWYCCCTHIYSDSIRAGWADRRRIWRL